MNTPRTDELRVQYATGHRHVSDLFAHGEKLETELAASQAEVERLKSACDKFSNSEIDQGDWKQRATAAEADLTKAQEQVIEWQAKNLLLRQELAAAREALTQWLIKDAEGNYPDEGAFYTPTLHPIARAALAAKEDKPL